MRTWKKALIGGLSVLTLGSGGAIAALAGTGPARPSSPAIQARPSDDRREGRREDRRDDRREDRRGDHREGEAEDRREDGVEDAHDAVNDDDSGRGGHDRGHRSDDGEHGGGDRGHGGESGDN
jgi:hypothetical protein